MSDWSSDVGSSALLAAVLSRRVAEVPFGGDGPIRPKAVFAQWLVGEARADALFRHDDDRLPQTLVRQLVERDEHERPAFAGRRGRFDKQILLAALLEIGRAHVELQSLMRISYAVFFFTTKST